MSASNLNAILSRDYDDDDPQAEKLFQSMKSLRIQDDQLQFDEPRQTIGKGGFGIVERAVFNPPNARPMVVAVKRIPGRSVSFNRLKKRTGREILIWSKLSHTNIIPFLGYEWHEAAEEVWLVCPWLAKGTIHDYLNSSLAGIEQRMKLTDGASHQELDGHLAPPTGPPAAPQPAVTSPSTERQRPSSGGRRSPSPARGSGGGGRGRGSPRVRNTAGGSRSPSPGSQGIRPNVDLRETGSPRDLTSILAKHQWNSLRRYDEPCSVFRTSIIPGSQVMAIVCVSQVYRTKDERTAAAKRVMKRLKQHRRKLLSPNIAHWVGFGLVSPWNYMCVVRWQEPGSVRLSTHLEEHPSPDRLNIVKQIANGLECLHSNNIVHGDLRVHTCVVNTAGTVQLAGFDLVELLGVTPEDLFTIRVSPLELLQGSPPTTATDVYAFANVALEVFTGSQPFIKLQRDATVLGALHSGGHSKAESYPDFPHKAAIWKLFKQCWDSDPTKRPVMSQVIEMLP
ncbi:hypothetical protein FS837_010853 [Tulasnella sp. UAMH 9824]|nr:hypothetical protein FS837_010853 [Tulasnella sp. UAMH 9824]